MNNCEICNISGEWRTFCHRPVVRCNLKLVALSCFIKQISAFGLWLISSPTPPRGNILMPAGVAGVGSHLASLLYGLVSCCFFSSWCFNADIRSLFFGYLILFSYLKLTFSRVDTGWWFLVLKTHWWGSTWDKYHYMGSLQVFFW